MFGRRFLYIVILLVVGGCSPKSSPIDYGAEGCHFCRMTIVDTQHAAEIVTQKGKTFKFDAVECMVNYRKEMDPNDIALYLCNHYTTPKELIDATKATFLISENIPSPMGEFLTAFETKQAAEKQKNESGGKLFTWEELLVELNR